MLNSPPNSLNLINLHVALCLTGIIYGGLNQAYGGLYLQPFSHG